MEYRQLQGIFEPSDVYGPVLKKMEEDQKKAAENNVKRNSYVNSGFDTQSLSLIHISEPTRRHHVSRMPSSA